MDDNLLHRGGRFRHMGTGTVNMEEGMYQYSIWDSLKVNQVCNVTDTRNMSFLSLNEFDDN